MALKKGRTGSSEQKALAIRQRIYVSKHCQAAMEATRRELQLSRVDLLPWFFEEQLTKATTVEWAATGLMAAQVLQVPACIST